MPNINIKLQKITAKQSDVFISLPDEIKINLFDEVEAEVIITRQRNRWFTRREPPVHSNGTANSRKETG